MDTVEFQKRQEARGLTRTRSLFERHVAEVVVEIASEEDRYRRWYIDTENRLASSHTFQQEVRRHPDLDDPWWTSFYQAGASP